MSTKRCSFGHHRFLWTVVGRVTSACALALGVVACSDTIQPIEPPSDYPLTLDVFTPGNVFSPPEAEIAKGGTIRFRMSVSSDNEGHNALFNGAAGAPPDVPVVRDTIVTRTFNTVGTFPYLCTVHPGMVGEVIVH